MLLIFSNQNSFSSTIRIFNMQKTSRINSDKSSLADKQKKHKHTTPNRRNNTGTSRDASDTPRNASTTDTAHRPPTQRIVHRHSASTTRSTSTIRTAPRPPTQHLVHRHSTSANAQHLDHRHSTSATDTAHRPHRQALSNRFSYFFSLHRGKIQQQLIVLLE